MCWWKCWQFRPQEICADPILQLYISVRCSVGCPKILCDTRRERQEGPSSLLVDAEDGTHRMELNHRPVHMVAVLGVFGKADEGSASFRCFSRVAKELREHLLFMHSFDPDLRLSPAWCEHEMNCCEPRTAQLHFECCNTRCAVMICGLSSIVGAPNVTSRLDRS